MDPVAGQTGRVTSSPGISGLQPEVGGSEVQGRLLPSLCSGELQAKEATWAWRFGPPDGAFHLPAPDFCETWRWAPGLGPCADLQQIDSKAGTLQPRQVKHRCENLS